MSLCNRPHWLTEVKKDNAANKGLTLAPFSGKHLQPPLQSLPPHGPPCFFPPCQTQNRQDRDERWATGCRENLQYFDIHFIHLNRDMCPRVVASFLYCALGYSVV